MIAVKLHQNSQCRPPKAYSAACMLQCLPCSNTPGNGGENPPQTQLAKKPSRNPLSQEHNLEVKSTGFQILAQPHTAFPYLEKRRGTHLVKGLVED